MIRLTSVRVRFGGVTALDLPAFELAPGERIGVEGANGSGKSTLLRLLAGFVRPTEGRAEGVGRPGRAVLIHQRPFLFRGTARSNVEYALRRHHLSLGEASSWLSAFGAEGFADRPVQGLSGGERARVALARAFAAHPETLLLDEPFAALDEAGRVAALAALAEFRGTLAVAAPDLAGFPCSRTIRLQVRSSFGAP